MSITYTHDDRANFLDALATLLGCTATMEAGLPDGRRPDVLRLNLSRGVLFIGDAKHTESRGCRETQARLLGYLRWLAAHMAGGRGDGVFAVCFGKSADAAGWINAVSMLWREADLGEHEHGIEAFEHGLVVAWFRPTVRLYRHRSNLSSTDTVN